MQRLAKMCATSRITVQRHICNRQNLRNEQKKLKSFKLQFYLSVDIKNSWNVTKITFGLLNKKNRLSLKETFIITHFQYQCLQTVGMYQKITFPLLNERIDFL